MKTIGKLISRIIFGPSLEDYEARQRAETVKAFKRIHTAYPVSKIPQAMPRAWGENSVQSVMSEDEKREAQIRAILIKQIEMQKRMLQHQSKGISPWVAGGNSNITATMSDGIEYIPPHRQEVFQNIRIKA